MLQEKPLSSLQLLQEGYKEMVMGQILKPV